MSMTLRLKKPLRRSTGNAKRDSTKYRKSTQNHIDYDLLQDGFIRRLLYNFLVLFSDKCIINKNFAKLKFFNGNSYTGWLGENGFEGFGNYEYADGANYRGLFEKSLTNNKGRFIRENGVFYDGEFLGGKRHGHGLYKMDGLQYNGNFMNGAFNGDGVWKANNCEKKGYFENGILLKGEVHEPTGVFKGTFDKFGLKKYGKYTFKNRNTYKGSWKNDLYFGYGVYNWVEESVPYTIDETKYVGYWMDGKRHALGMLAVCGRHIISQWSEDMKIGAGVVYTINGNCYAGTNLFDKIHYHEGVRIRRCPESKALLAEILKLITSATGDDMDKKSTALAELIQDLVAGYGDLPSSINSIRIPNYELGNMIPDFCSSDFEVTCLQQVFSENCYEFEQLYQEYKHPADKYLNLLSLNMMYMDLFHMIIDVSTFECMTNSCKIISNLNLKIKDNACLTQMSPISFYEFFQHIVYITKVLMQSEELRTMAEDLKPTFFATLPMQVIVVLKILKSTPKPKFLVREAILKCRPAVLNIIHSMEKNAFGDKSISVAYRYLKSIDVVRGSSWNFIKAVESYFENIFKDGRLIAIDFKVSSLQLVEIVLCTCKLNLEQRQRAIIKRIQSFNAMKVK